MLSPNATKLLSVFNALLEVMEFNALNQEESALRHRGPQGGKAQIPLHRQFGKALRWNRERPSGRIHLKFSE